jgi:hypothetical protein
MEQQNNNIEEITTTTAENTNEAAVSVPKEDAIWNGKLADLEEWQIARQNLNKWLDEAEEGTFGQYFESKNQRSAPFSYQNLAIVCHTSSGYIGDKVKKAKELGMKSALDKKEEYNERLTLVNMILDCLAPNLAEERAKREAERLARVAEWNARVNSVWSAVDSILDTWHEFDIPCSLASVRKIYAKYKDKENGLNIVATLAETNLNSDDIKTLESEMGLRDGDLCDYWLDKESLNNPPEKA